MGIKLIRLGSNNLSSVSNSSLSSLCIAEMLDDCLALFRLLLNSVAPDLKLDGVWSVLIYVVSSPLFASKVA